MNFHYTPEKLAALERLISPERVAPYMVAADQKIDAAVKLYELNTRLSAAFYGPLQGLEVCVRNAIDEQLRSRFGEDWITLENIQLQPQQEGQVRQAIEDCLDGDENDNSRRDYCHGDVIANLSFGFWVGLLNPKNEVEIWRKAVYKAFPHRPKGVERKAIQGALNSIRRLRNRVAHHCRIIHRDLEKDHRTILDVIGWVCPHTRDWVASLSEFDPSMIPVPQPALPLEGLAAIDPVPPTEKPRPVRPSLNGRAILSVVEKDNIPRS